MTRLGRALLLCAALLTTASPALADAVDDSPCQRWEHWEGGHDGRCAAGPRCSVAPGASGGPEHLALAIAGAAALLVERRGRRTSRRSGG